MRGGCPFISTGRTLLDFLGAGLVPTISYRKGKIVDTVIFKFLLLSGLDPESSTLSYFPNHCIR